MQPLISVIIPVYNVEPYLRQCLDTVINQTLQNIEIICVNDGSTDNSPKILEEYASKDKRIIILSQENKGSGPTLNAGILKATGEFIAIMDSDDYYPSKKVLEVLYHLAKKTGVLICGGSAVKLQDGKILSFNNIEDGYYFKTNGYVNYIDYQYDYGYWRFIYNREFILKNNLLFEDYRRYKDPIFFVKAMTLAKRFFAIKYPVYVYRVLHKEIEWNLKKVRDCIRGITDVLKFSSENNLTTLHYRYATKKIYDDWLINNAFNLLPENDEILMNMLNSVNLELVHNINPEYSLPQYENITTPKVSIIIPVHNAEKYLKECLDSIINQTLKDIEIICVNDGSTDNSLKILEEYKKKDNRIIILNQENQGAGSSRNNGLAIARGKYLSFLDSDDFFKLVMLEKMYDQAEKDNSDIVMCSFSEYDSKTHKIKTYIKPSVKSPFTPIEMRNNLFDINSLNAWTKLFKRDLFVSNNLHFENTERCNDFTCVCTALAIANKISLINESFIYYRINQNTSLTENKHKDLDSFFIAVQCLEDNLKHFNVYDTFKSAFDYRMKKAFKWESNLYTKEQNNKRKEIARELLSKRLYSMFYNIKEKEQPLVSIVSLLYDVKKEYVNKCIDSLLKQTYQNIEIIFVDDCSPTIDYSYITSLSPKIKLVRNETNLGFNRNSQKSFNLATGKYVVKVDSDDYIDPTMVEKEVKVLEENPNVGAVCCELQRFGLKNGHISRPKEWSLEEALFKSMGKYGYEGGMMFRRKLLDEIAVDPHFRVCTDFDLHLQILEHMPIKSIHETLYFYRSHESNIMKTASKNNERINTVKRILDKHRQIYKQKHTKQRQVIKKNKYF